jgi:hypothetical protein
VVSEVNLQEVDNAINQAQKELAQRFDFKNSKSSIALDLPAKKLTLIGDDDFKLRALRDIVEGRFAKRGVSIKALTYKEPEQAFEGTLRQVIELASGIPREKAKDIITLIKNSKLKVQVQIEGEKLRVISAKKDDLQAVMALLRGTSLPIALQFTNFR